MKYERGMKEKFLQSSISAKRPELWPAWLPKLREYKKNSQVESVESVLEAWPITHQFIRYLAWISGASRRSVPLAHLDVMIASNLADRSARSR